MVCVTLSEHRGQCDDFDTLRIGSYLTQYYSDTFTPNQIRDIVAELTPPDEVFFAHTPDEIVGVYTSPGPSSCMQYDDDASNWQNYGRYNPGRNPTFVYGAGDLAVAYLKNPSGKISARVLVWPEKKVYSRIYGDVERMEIALEQMGYECDVTEHNLNACNKGGFDGARLLRVVTDHGRMIAPYIDAQYGVQDKGDYLVMCHQNSSDWSCKNQYGLVTDYDEDEEDDFYAECSRCGSDIYSEDDRYRHPITREYSICWSCHDEGFGECDHCGATTDSDNITYLHNLNMDVCTRTPVRLRAINGCATHHEGVAVRV